MKRAPVRAYLMVVAWPFLLTSLAVPCALLRVLLGKTGRRITNERVIAPAARAFVRGLGVELVSRVRPRPAGEQVIYTLNHTSSLDLAVMGLALPATRGFMKRAMWAMPPLGLLAWAGGCIFTVPQKYTARRHKLFARACEAVRKSGESLLLSPEGTRVTTGTVGHFNKGAFHLATALGANIVPLYIEIDQQADPGRGWLVKERGRMTVHELDEVDTSDWTLDELEANAAFVRGRYLDFQRELRGELDSPRMAA